MKGRDGMVFSEGVREQEDVSAWNESGIREASKAAQDQFDRLMGDDKIQARYGETGENVPRMTKAEREAKFARLFEKGDFFEKDLESPALKPAEAQQPESLYETDDHGRTYKKDGELLPDGEYTVNGNTYRTDGYGNIIACDSRPVYTEEGSRNMKEQRESGGEERQDSDDGGHIIARILGGAEGSENLVPMRRTINRGDYKKMENEIAAALQEGKEVVLHIELQYEGDSGRPSKLQAAYTIEGKQTVWEFDNKEHSAELLNSLKDKINDEDYRCLKQELKDMKMDGADGSVTSVKSQYDENGRVVKVTAGILDESTGEKFYKVYEP